ncbi:SMP-30/gluconolactonase/LRE family protein [Streptomyces sp. NPDC048392]|uniref:SMP-30/gluconolactonase/LRE family protein n=1 Tax=Streptomyces sp. NPDC048392 TaxID=3365543 RepID=UPI003722F2F2
MTAAPRSARPDRLELGEGIRWTADGRLVLVDILAGRLLEATGPDDAPLRVLARLPRPLGAVAPVADRPGTWTAAVGTGIRLLAPDGTTTWPAWPGLGEDAPVRMRMNDATADPAGRFWAGSMAYDATEGAGSLYRADHDGRVERVLDGITVPNGPAFTANGHAMYLAESARAVIRRYPVDPVTGSLGAPRSSPPSTRAVPTARVDAEDGLWVAVWGTGTVRRYRQDGDLVRVVRLSARQPAGLCLQGDVLHITTARVGLTAPGPDDGALFSLRVDVPGHPASAYRLDTPVPMTEEQQ